MSAAVAAPADPEQALAWEAEHRPRAALAAVLAAGLTVAGAIFSGLALRGLPGAEDRAQTVIDTLGRAASGQPQQSGRLAEQADWLGDHAVLPIAGAVLFTIGTLLIFGVLAFLFRAARARRPQVPQIALIMAAIGTVTFAVGRGVAEIARYVGAMGFRDSADRTNSAAADALGGPVAVAGQVLWQVGSLALGFAFVIIALNAMRAGLLSRFMGVLGMIVGATFVLPLDQQGVIRVFWLAALAALLAGRWPRGIPPAWTTGLAEPWPSQQQLREQREAAHSGGGDGPQAAPASRPPTPAAPRVPVATPHSSSKKRKRKRRA